MLIAFLNKKVQKEAQSDPRLYLVYRVLHRGYDPDIDPVHDEDWVKTMAWEEEKQLDRAKKLMAELLKGFDLGFFAPLLNPLRRALREMPAHSNQCHLSASEVRDTFERAHTLSSDLAGCEGSIQHRIEEYLSQHPDSNQELKFLLGSILQDVLALSHELGGGG